MEAILLIGSNPLVAGTAEEVPLTTRALEVIAFLLPDLDRFARSDWLIAGTAGLDDLWHAAAQTAVYLLLIAGASLFDLQRKVL